MMDEPEQLEMFEELMKRDEDLVSLREENARLRIQNHSMRKTIETVLRVKCKRGEGAFSLNTELKACIDRNAAHAINHCCKNMSLNRVSDIVNKILLHTLVGVNGTSVPCAVLNNTPPIVVFKDNDLWVALTISEFSELYYKHMQSHVIRYSRDNVNDDTTDTQMTVLNNLLNNVQFMPFVKQMLRMYKDY
jgi:hypothetical protein